MDDVNVLRRPAALERGGAGPDDLDRFRRARPGRSDS